MILIPTHSKQSCQITFILVISDRNGTPSPGNSDETCLFLSLSLSIIKIQCELLIRKKCWDFVPHHILTDNIIQILWDGERRGRQKFPFTLIEFVLETCWTSRVFIQTALVDVSHSRQVYTTLLFTMCSPRLQMQSHHKVLWRCVSLPCDFCIWKSQA